MAGPHEWWDETWNVVTGCTQVSAGCMNCYAKRISTNLTSTSRYRAGFQPTLHLDPDTLTKPSTWGKARYVFVCSMGDLFHEVAHADFLRRVFSVMASESRHTYMVLTKRPERMLEWAKSIHRWPTNVWAGTTVEDVSQLKRLDMLRQVPARTRFVSFEPLLSSVWSPNLDGIHWAIVGGETGPDARFMEQQWAEEVLDACLFQGVKFWFKQWGSRYADEDWRFHGKVMRERPEPSGTQRSLF